MPSINLTTEDVSEKSMLSLGTGVILSLAVLILIFCVYGALLIINKDVSAKIKDVENEYKIEYNKFLSGSGGDIIDFKNRSAVAKDLINKSRSSSEIFFKLEEATIPSVYLSSLKYDENNKVINLACIGNDLHSIAKQIASFKESNYFSSVNAEQISLDEEINKFNFSINLKLK